MRASLIAFGLAALLGACAQTGSLDPAAATVACLPKGVYLGKAFGARYTAAQKAAIDALRVLNCPDPVGLGYGAPA